MSQPSYSVENKGQKQPIIKLNFATEPMKSQENNGTYVFKSNLLNLLERNSQQSDIQNGKIDNAQQIDQQNNSLCLQHKSKMMFICEDESCIQKEKVGCNKCMNAYHNQHKTKILDENEKDEFNLQKSLTQVKQSFMRFQNCIRVPTQNRQINLIQSEDQKKQNQEIQIENVLNGCVFNNSPSSLINNQNQIPLELQQKNIQNQINQKYQENIADSLKQQNQIGQQLFQQNEQLQQNQIGRQQLIYPAHQQCNTNQFSVGTQNKASAQQYLLDQQNQLVMSQPQYMQMVTLYPQTYGQNFTFNMQQTVMQYPNIPTIYCQNPYMLTQQQIQNQPFNQNQQSNLNYLPGQINIPQQYNSNFQMTQNPQIINQIQIPQQNNIFEIKPSFITNQQNQNSLIQQQDQQLTQLFGQQQYVQQRQQQNLQSLQQQQQLQIQSSQYNPLSQQLDESKKFNLNTAFVTNYSVNQRSEQPQINNQQQSQILQNQSCSNSTEQVLSKLNHKSQQHTIFQTQQEQINLNYVNNQSQKVNQENKLKNLKIEQEEINNAQNIKYSNENNIIHQNLPKNNISLDQQFNGLKQISVKQEQQDANCSNQIEPIQLTSIQNNPVTIQNKSQSYQNDQNRQLLIQNSKEIEQLPGNSQEQIELKTQQSNIKDHIKQENNHTYQNVQQLRHDYNNFSSFGQSSNGNKKVNVQYFIDNKCMKSQYTSLDKVIHQHIDYYPSIAFLNPEKFIQISLNTYEMKYYLNLVDIKTKKILEKREISPVFQTLKQTMQFDENKKIIVQKINNEISAIYERGQDFIDIISNVNLKVVKRLRHYSVQKIASYNKGRGLAVASLSGKVTLYNINCNKFLVINEFNVRNLKSSALQANQQQSNLEQEDEQLGRDQQPFREQFQFLLNCDIFIQNNILLWCGSSLFTFTYCLIDIKSSARLIINPTQANYPNNILNDNCNKIQISNVQMFNDRVYFEFNNIDKRSDHFESSMNSCNTLLLSKYNVLQYKFQQEENKFTLHSSHPNSNLIKSYNPLKEIFLFNQQKSHIIGIQLINKCSALSQQGGKNQKERNIVLKNVVYPNIVSRKHQKDFQEIKFKMNLSLLQNSQTFYVYLTKSNEQTTKNESFITLVDNKKVFHKVFLSQSQYTTKLA